MDEVLRLITARRTVEEQRRQEEYFLEKEEELKIREEILKNNEHRLLIAQQDFLRQKEDYIRALEDERRKAEDEKRREEDERRRLEDERRRIEDERRKQEDARRRAEDERRAKEDEARRAYIAEIHAQQLRQAERAQRRAQTAQRRAIADRVTQIEDLLIKQKIKDVTIYKRIEQFVSTHADITDVKVLVDMLLAEAQSSNTNKPTGTASHEIEDEFMLLDDVTTTPPQSKPIVQTSLTSSAPLPSSPSPTKSQQQHLAASVTPVTSPARNTPQRARDSKIFGDALGFEDEFPPDEEDEEEYLEWIMIDPSVVPLEPEPNESRQARFIEKIQQRLLGKGSMREQRKQEDGQTRDLTASFKQIRASIAEHSIKNVQSIVERMRGTVELLSENGFDPISALSDLNPFNKITLTNKDTWISCMQCREFFDKLSFKHTCRLCHGNVCTKCGLKSITFSPTLLGIATTKVNTITEKACLPCRAVIKRLQRSISVNQIRMNPRALHYSKQYALVSELKAKILDAVKTLDSCVSTDSSSTVEQTTALVEAEKNLVTLLRQYQEAMTNVQQTIAHIKSKQTADSPSMQTEIRMLTMMRSGMAGFLVENKKLLSHYKALHARAQSSDASSNKHITQNSE